LGLALLGHDLVTSTSTTWHLLFVLDKHRQAFYLILYISKASAADKSGRFSNPPTTPSPVRYRPPLKTNTLAGYSF